MKFGGWDESLFRWINQAGRDGWDPLGLLLSDGRFWWIFSLVVTTVLLFKGMRGRLLRVWLVLLLALGVSDAFHTYVLKPTFRRPRPCHGLADVRLVPPACGSAFGFPSNHAGNAATIATVVAISFASPWRWLTFGLALLTGLSRIYLGVHYPGDVLTGFLVGTFVGMMITSLAQRVSPLRRPIY